MEWWLHWGLPQLVCTYRASRLLVQYLIYKLKRKVCTIVPRIVLVRRTKLGPQFFLMYTSLIDRSITAKYICHLHLGLSGVAKGLTYQCSQCMCDRHQASNTIVRFKMPAVMALRIGANEGSFSAALQEVSKNSMVGNTQEMVGMRSEENTCWARAGCCIYWVRKWSIMIMEHCHTLSIWWSNPKLVHLVAVCLKLA